MATKYPYTCNKCYGSGKEIIAHYGGGLTKEMRVRTVRERCSKCSGTGYLSYDPNPKNILQPKIINNGN